VESASLTWRTSASYASAAWSGVSKLPGARCALPAGRAPDHTEVDGGEIATPRGRGGVLGQEPAAVNVEKDNSNSSGADGDNDDDSTTTMTMTVTVTSAQAKTKVRLWSPRCYSCRKNDRTDVILRPDRNGMIPGAYGK